MEVPTRSEHLPQTARDQPTVRKRRACEPCRSLKARCLFENPDLAQCTNCIKCKRRCVIGDDRRYPRLSESTEGAGPQLRNIGSSMLGGSRASEGMPQDGR
jgi:hypothetical protein